MIHPEGHIIYTPQPRVLLLNPYDPSSLLSRALHVMSAYNKHQFPPTLATSWRPIFFKASFYAVLGRRGVLTCTGI